MSATATSTSAGTSDADALADLIMVNSKQLTRDAATIRERGEPQRARNGVIVSAEQFETCARILRDADPCVCNGDVQERPGFIHASDQTSEDALTFRMGILPSATFLIARDGRILEQRA